MSRGSAEAHARVHVPASRYDVARECLGLLDDRRVKFLGPLELLFLQRIVIILRSNDNN